MSEEIGTPDNTKNPRYFACPDVQSFLDRLGRAAVSADTTTLASLWKTPSVVLGDDEVIEVRDTDQIERLFSGAKDQYQARGICDTRAEIQDLVWTSDHSCIVTVRWPYYDHQGEELGSETSTYTLQRDEQRRLWLRSVVMHSEAATTKQR